MNNLRLYLITHDDTNELLGWLAALTVVGVLVLGLYSALHHAACHETNAMGVPVEGTCLWEERGPILIIPGASR
ncbi:hypothetical protein [Nitrospirillum viridazoti]|uniref:Uncharacterized protein n=1 Tax=Nitrospirillum amazonense TaxID=28077 RepID=A0A560II28_9PROT|nr:hypothetical protein [Nitrospirillum amazonense]TWB58703.1 hypothetical protein FBZ92_109196 [Nitrospirillum amazonense]